MQNRGLSDMVTTVLLIIVALVAVVIIWNFISPTLKSANINTAAYTAQFSVPQNSLTLDPNSNNLTLNINRGAGPGDVVGFLVGLQDPAGQITTFRQNITIGQLESKQIGINYTALGVPDIIGITVTPIFRNNQTLAEQLGQPITQTVPPANKKSFLLPSGLVAHWRFDGGWSDDTNGLNGAPNGNAVIDLNNKRIGSGSANLFGASTSYVSVSNNNLLNSNVFTAILWVNPRALTGSSTSTLLDKSDFTTGFKVRYDLASNNWQFYTTSTPLNILNLTESNSLNNWVFIAVSINNQNQKNFYYNSNLVTTQAPSYVIPSSSSSLKIGPFLNGNIDEVMFFNRALSTQEVNDIRNKYKG